MFSRFVYLTVRLCALTIAAVSTFFALAGAGHAGDLKLGQLLVGDQELGLSGTCGRGLTHLDLDTGEQYPLTIRLLTSGATALANNDVLSWARSGTQLELVRITPASGAHRLTFLDDNDFANPKDMAEDQNGDYVISNDSAVGRLELQTGIFEILASGGDLVDPAGLAIAANGDIFIADPTAATIFRFQSSTGTAPFAQGGMLSAPVALDFAPNGDLLVGDSQQIIRIDAVTAAQSVFGTPFIAGVIEDLTVNESGEVFVLQGNPKCSGTSFTSGIHRVPEMGDPVPVLCVHTTLTAPIKDLGSISAKPGGDNLIVYGKHTNDGAGNADAVFELNPDDASFELISIRPPSGAFAFAPDGSLFLAVHELDSIFEIDPRTGVSTNIAAGGLLSDPRDLIVADDGSFLYVLDNDSVVRVNPVTGSQAAVYDGSAFNDPVHIRRDRNGDYIVADLFAAELIFLDSTTFSESTISGGDIFRVVDVADTGSGDLLVADVGPNSLIRVDPSSGVQSLVGGAGYFSPASPASMLPEDNGNVLVAVGGAGALGLVRIDPSDASQSIVSGMPICIGADMEHVVLAPEPVVCGDPVDSGGALVARVSLANINATDALFTLRAGVGSETCELCVCDVDDSGDLNASDALLVLQVGVGQPVDLNCPDC